MRIGHVLVVALVSSTGCSLYFSHDDGRGQEAPDAGGSASTPVGSGSTNTTGSCGGAMVDVKAMDSRCSAPEGPAVILDSSTVATQLTGCWWMCGGAAEFFGDVEFTADQHFYMLSKVDGYFIRNLGPDSSGTYTIDPSDSGISFSIHQHYQDGTGATYPLHGFVEIDPKKVAIGGGNYAAIPAP